METRIILKFIRIAAILRMVMSYILLLSATLAQSRYILVLPLVLTYAIATGAGKHAQSLSESTASKTQLPTVQQILEKYVHSIGGKTALGKLSSRIMKGSYAIPTKGYITPVEMFWKAPDKFKLVFTGKRNTAARGVDGNTGWSRDWSEEGVREINGPELIADQREVDFYREIKLNQLYPQMTLKGLEKVNDKDVYAIDAVASEGTHETMYFEIDSGLLVRRDLKLFLSIANVQLNLMNYKEVDGIKLPFTIQVVRTEKPFMNIFSFDVALLNPKIDDRQFAKPAVK